MPEDVSRSPVPLLAAVALVSAWLVAGATPQALAESPAAEPRPYLGHADADRLIIEESAAYFAEPFTVTLYIENDSIWLIPNMPEDRDYTHGAAMSFAGQPDWADDLVSWAPFDFSRDPTRTAFGFLIGNQIYTPNNINNSEPSPDDQPYVGYLYIGAYLQRSNAYTAEHVQIDLGMIGPSALGRQIQTEFHALVGSERPEGWDFQLGDEPTFQVYWRKRWRWRPFERPAASHTVAEPRRNLWALELIPMTEVALGTVHRRVEGGLLVRWGLNLPDDFGPGRLESVIDATGRPWADGHVTAYVFGRVTGRLVEHNLFHEGNTWRESRSVTPEPLVGIGEFGVVLSHRVRNARFNFSYSQIFQTRTYKTQQDWHAYGQFSISLTLGF